MDFTLAVDEQSLPTTKRGRKIDNVALSNGPLILQEISTEPAGRYELRSRFANASVVRRFEDSDLTHIPHVIKADIVDCDK